MLASATLIRQACFQCGGTEALKKRRTRSEVCLQQYSKSVQYLFDLGRVECGKTPMLGTNGRHSRRRHSDHLRCNHCSDITSPLIYDTEIRAHLCWACYGMTNRRYLMDVCWPFLNGRLPEKVDNPVR